VPEQESDLTVVLETNNGIQLALAKGLLDDAGMPYYVQGQIATLVQDIDPFMHKWVRLQVPRQSVQEALEILEPVLHPRPHEVGED